MVKEIKYSPGYLKPKAKQKENKKMLLKDQLTESVQFTETIKSRRG
jgi:hypothetical protein